MAKSHRKAVALIIVLCVALLIVTPQKIVNVKADSVTFGRTTSDTTNATVPSGYLCGSQATLSTAGTLVKISVYACGSSDTCMAKAVIYSVSGGQPDALLAESAEQNVKYVSGLRWVDFTFDYNLAAGTYFIAVAANVAGLIVGHLASQPSGSSEYRTVTYGALPDPFGSHTDSTNLRDIYGTVNYDTYTLDLTVTSPTNTTYDETVPVSLSLAGNDTNPVYSWNVQFSNSSWLYGSNQTDTSYTMEIYENQTDCLFACTVIGDNCYDYEEVYFSVLYIPADAWDADLNNYFCAAILLVMGFVFMVFMFRRTR